MDTLELRVRIHNVWQPFFLLGITQVLLFLKSGAVLPEHSKRQIVKSRKKKKRKQIGGRYYSPLYLLYGF
jgi:hypothetical protein